ncbi:uncharacterized protein LOC101450819 [Ceratitis capitata]|uniref:uncharacterized protein LOC101450819 n=1 Tax=Ceratitis capitata TaxID=7213 RepID=UPI00032A1416|nr:uncharacterized protein LOC101450819 [Ceratitis capitata]
MHSLGTHAHGTTLEQAIIQYFGQKTNVVHIRLQLSGSIFWKRVVLHHLTDALRNSSNITFRITIGDRYLRDNKYFQYNLWYVDSYEALNTILPYKKKHFGSKPSVYAIIMEKFGIKNNISHIQEILEKMFALNIIDVIVVVRNRNGKGFLVYSFEPFAENHCRIVKPVIVNQFIAGHFAQSELFPNKLRDLHNCSIRVSSRNVSLYFSYHKQITDGAIAMTGLEVQLLKTIAEYLNFSIELVLEESHIYGDIYTNGTMSGPYRLLDENHVDILMGFFFYDATGIAFFEQSLSYFLSALVVIVKRRVPLSKNDWILEPFQLDTWLLLLALVGLSITFIYIAHLRYNTGNWLDIIGSIFGEPRMVKTKNYLVRFSIALWFAGFVFLSGIYQAKLFDSYNKPTCGAPHTITDLLNDNFTLLVGHYWGLQYLVSDLKFPESRIEFINSTDIDTLLETLLNSSGNVASLATVARIRYFEHQHQLDEVFDQVSETVQLSEICAYFQHHSYLAVPFNKLISTIRSSGLISKWYDNEMTESREKVKKPQAGAFKRLDMRKLTINYPIYVKYVIKPLSLLATNWDNRFSQASLKVNTSSTKSFAID